MKNILEYITILGWLWLIGGFILNISSPSSAYLVAFPTIGIITLISTMCYIFYPNKD